MDAADTEQVRLIREWVVRQIGVQPCAQCGDTVGFRIKVRGVILHQDVCREVHEEGGHSGLDKPLQGDYKTISGRFDKRHHALSMVRTDKH